MLHTINFINIHSNWREILSEHPYYIKIVDEGCFTILKYNQFKSDFHNPIIKECRGLIIDNKTNQPVCIPFFKFGNYGESYADEIDWSTAEVQEKVDGSLIKLFNYNGEWHVSTNGTIDARNAQLKNNISNYKNFRELFDVAWNKYYPDFSILNPYFTYMFELISPYNRVVVPYSEIDIRYIGARNNETFQEYKLNIGIPQPKQYHLCSLNDCINSAKSLPYREEGYVVVDAKWHRIKIKSPAYILIHHMMGNNTVTKRRIVDLIKAGEDEEFLTYYPEYTESFVNIKSKIEIFITNVKSIWNDINAKNYSNRKDLVLEIQKDYSQYSHILFALYNKKVDNIREWLYNHDSNKILKHIGEE